MNEEFDKWWTEYSVSLPKDISDKVLERARIAACVAWHVAKVRESERRKTLKPAEAAK